MEKLRYCRRCLLEEEIRQGEADLEKYLHALDPADCVSQECYEKRLSFCASCKQLSGQTCLLCGCYVQLRAAAKRGTCPRVPSMWK